MQSTSEQPAREPVLVTKTLVQQKSLYDEDLHVVRASWAEAVYKIRGPKTIHAYVTTSDPESDILVRYEKVRAVADRNGIESEQIFESGVIGHANQNSTVEMTTDIANNEMVRIILTGYGQFTNNGHIRIDEI
jgi:hypothetical protein